MKAKFNRVIALLLCALMLLPTTGFAWEARPSDATDFISMRYDPLSGPQYSVSSVKADAPFATNVSTPYYSYEEAVKYARNQLKKRVTQFGVCYDYSGSFTQDYLNKVFYDVMEHTGVPDEGDYILYQAGISLSAGRDNRGRIYLYFGFTSENNSLVDSPIIYYSSAAQETQVNSAVQSLISELGLTSSSSDYDKILAVYNWMCENITYDYDHLGDESYRLQYTAYAALINKTAVCQGYANLFYRLMLELGVDARIIGGVANTGEGHAWNIVTLSNRDYYYFIDTTWGSQQIWAWTHYYFLRGLESDFDEEHIPDPEYNTPEWNAKYPIDPRDYLKDGECLHENTELIGEREPTCTLLGFTGYTYCHDCGKVLYEGTYIHAKGHTIDWASGDTETCTVCGEYACRSHEYEPGKAVWLSITDHYTTCTICGYQNLYFHRAVDHDTGICIDCGGETDYVPGSHDDYLEEDYNAKPATCTEDGYTGDLWCNMCQRAIIKGEVIPAIGGDHVFEDGVCTKCGYNCPHPSWDVIGYKEPTCTDKGYDGDIVCEVCKCVMYEGTEIPARGHQWGDDGKCVRCGIDKPDGIPGDLSQDGEVDVTDGVLMQRVLANLLDKSDPATILADLDGNGVVDVSDGVVMQRILADLE